MFRLLLASGESRLILAGRKITTGPAERSGSEAGPHQVHGLVAGAVTPRIVECGLASLAESARGQTNEA